MLNCPQNTYSFEMLPHKVDPYTDTLQSEENAATWNVWQNDETN